MNPADTKASLGPLLDRVLNGEALAENDAYELMHRFAAGELDPALAGAFLAGLRAKGETADEVRGFARAMREGISRSGSELYPAFPFDHFTRLSDDDVSALYAYLMSQPAVIAPKKENKLPFPLNIRALQAGWKLLFLDKGRFASVAGKNEEWNRGAYLAEGLGHCGACHTPRNLLGAEKEGEHTYAGAFIDGWQAPALNAGNAAPLAWNTGELFAYLRTGGTALHGSATGPMSEVVHDGLAALPDSDIRALALYFADINGSAARSAESGARLASLIETQALKSRATYDKGADLYRSACASCHYNSANPPDLLR